MALTYTLSPTLASVTVVVPTTKGLHVLPSVEYSRETSGGDCQPPFAIATVELASYAVKQSSGLVGSTVQPTGIALVPVVVSEPS